MPDVSAVSLNFKWPKGPHWREDFIEAGEEMDLYWTFNGTSPSIPNVGEDVVFRDPAKEDDGDVWIRGKVVRREFSYATGSYQHRSESHVTLFLEDLSLK